MFSGKLQGISLELAKSKVSERLPSAVETPQPLSRGGLLPLGPLATTRLYNGRLPCYWLSNFVSTGFLSFNPTPPRARAMTTAFKRSGAGEIMDAHLQSLMTFDKNNGFELPEGDFVPKSLFAPVPARLDERQRTRAVFPGLAPEKHAVATDLIRMTTDIKKLHGHYVLDPDVKIAELEAMAQLGCPMARMQLMVMKECPMDADELQDVSNFIFHRFKVGEMRYALLQTDRQVPQCTVGTVVMCATLTEDSQPLLLFSSGYGELIGGGFGGQSLEIEDNIQLALRAADMEGRLLPSEFLACLLSVSLGAEVFLQVCKDTLAHTRMLTRKHTLDVQEESLWYGSPIEDFAESAEGGHYHKDNPRTPHLSKACQILCHPGADKE